jgi:capsular exopolysaccharide synthesis family protein
MSRLAEALGRAGDPAPAGTEVFGADERDHAEPPPLGVFQGFDAAVAERLVTAPALPPAALEQYRNLAATLHHAQVERGVKVVMIASALGAEGKTLTSVNLALTLSGSYRRNVLIIDADLRRPGMHALFKVPNTSGLTNALQADADRTASVIEICPSLSLLTAGPPGPDPMSLLTSERLRRLLEEAAKQYDWVIIDTPPVGLLTDANLLASVVDLSVLVVRAGATPHKLIQRAIDTLGRERIIGVVLNAVEPRALADDGYYRGYYPAQSGGR